jgi:hypothetical protein
MWACGQKRVGVWAWAVGRKGSDVALDLDLRSIGTRQSRSSIRGLALTPTRRHADTPIRPHAPTLLLPPTPPADEVKSGKLCAFP